jgi:hypothetical protein
LSVLLVLECIA